LYLKSRETMSTKENAYFYKVLKEKIENTNTSTNYQQRLNGLVQRITEYHEKHKRPLNKDLIYHILKHPSNYQSTIEKIYDNNELTIKNIATLILALFKYAELKCKLEKQYEKWKAFHEVYYEKENKRYEKNLPTETQKQKYIAFDEMERIFKSLKNPHEDMKESLKYSLFAMYMNIRPKRSDFGELKIYKKDPGKNDINYIVLPTKISTSSAKSTAFIVFNHLNKVNIKEPIIEPIPPTLHAVFIESTTRYPRDYLFVGQDGKPFKTPNAFGKFVTRTFEQYTGKKIGTSMLRHMFINEKLNLNELSIEEKNEYARAMGHDRQQQEKYKLFFDKSDSKDT